MNYQVFAVCTLLVALASVLSFVAGCAFALCRQRRHLAETGYTMIGNELYRAELVAAPKAEKQRAN